MDNQWARVKRIIHGIFIITINIMQTAYHGTNLVSSKMRFLHPPMTWNHINLYFGI